MARIARVIAENMPHHITQRGNRRQQTFFSEDDYTAYLELMAEWCGKYDVQIWAYCLMPNHIHLIIILKKINNETEKKQYGLISTVMKSLKGIITKEIRKSFDIPFEWQRSFYDHIVRNEKSLHRISSYIKHNELKWLFESNIPRN